MKNLCAVFLGLFLTLTMASADESAEIAEKVKQLADLGANIAAVAVKSTLMTSCKAAIDKLPTGDLNTEIAKECIDGLSAKQLANAEEVLPLFLKRISDAADEIKSLAEEIQSESPEEASLRNGSKSRVGLDSKYIKLVSVSAGDLKNRRTCDGLVPLSKLVELCFGNPASTPTRIVDVRHRSCLARSVTIDKLCGHQPAPQGLNLIEIKYRCGGQTLEYKTLPGDIALHCDSGKLIAQH